MIKICVKISKFSKYQECIYLYHTIYIQFGEGEKQEKTIVLLAEGNQRK